MLEFNATFLVAMLSFIVFIVIMNSILYKPISRIQKEREELIEYENSVQEQTVTQINSLKDHYSKIVENSKNIAKVNFSNTISEYKERKDNLLNSAKTLIKKDLEVAQAKLDGDIREVNAILKPQINKLASEIASKVLNQEITIKG